ncbi:MAG: trypsin-like peptidase domain-containing protein [Leptolyngbyaceae bacterium]|nr:trypsin-like peptidase domain-containing protein [Leptolyngbyaceae bacterium]
MARFSTQHWCVLAALTGMVVLSVAGDRPPHSSTQSSLSQQREAHASNLSATHSEANAELETASSQISHTSAHASANASDGGRDSERYPSGAIADAVDAVYRSVVTVTTQQGTNPYAPHGLQPQSSASHLPPSRYDSHRGVPLSGSPTTSLVSTAGSGVVIDETGLILTNAHVVNGALEVILTFWTDEQVTGQVLGQDDALDMALIQVPVDDLPDGLPIVSLGNSDDLRIGEWAIAIGHPLGLEHTVTVGIISAMGRHRSTLQNAGSIQPGDQGGQFIQTDAAINPGNSGGPLLNDAGELIGITTARLSDAQGIGFAVPVNEAKQFVQNILRTPHTSDQDRPNRNTPDQHAADQHVDSPNETEGAIAQSNEQPLANDSSVFGIRATVVEAEARTAQISPTIVILDVIEGSRASRAGIRAGDIILSVDGSSIPSLPQLRERLMPSHRQQPQSIDILRNGTSLTLHL